MKTLSVNYPDVFRFSLAIASAVLATTVTLGLLLHPLCFLLGAAIPIVLTIRQGIEFDFANQKYRKFKAFLHSKNGDWKSYDPANELVILSKTGYQPNGNLDQYEGVRKVFDLYMVDPAHKRRMYISSADNLKDIKALAAKITGRSTLTLSVYSPKH